MGFLDHSTNNIIVDAVLTDMGRKYLSRQDGSFSISQFALGDDEYDDEPSYRVGLNISEELAVKIR